MIFAKDSANNRTARSRRALPSRRRWPYALAAVAIMASLAGGAFWFLRDGRRLPQFSLESVKSFFRSRPAIEAPPAREDLPEKQKGRAKRPVAEKAEVRKKNSSQPAKAVGTGKAPSVESLRADNANMAKQLQGMAPKGMYLVINTAGNRVLLYNGDKVEADMVASCGSGNVLEDPKGGRRWTFDTPRGVYSVKTKITDPVWMKPDWAFIEEGEPIPSNRADRAEPGMMGDYALGIGNGYFIHGTLYTRLLGRNVSHGCVRLGDADLEKLYRSLPIGTQVYIF